MSETRMHQPLTNADDLITLAQTFLEALSKGLRSLPEFDKLQSLERIVATSLAIVRSSTNEWRPIHKLPAEILGRIFQLVPPSNVPGFFRSDDFDAMKSDLRARMVISHVCVRWRAIALDMATFWNIVDMTSPPWALAGLERSRAVPIHVFARYPLHNTVAGSLLASQGLRIHGFSLEIPIQHQATVPGELVEVLPPVPNLECLCITTYRDEYGTVHPFLDLEHRPRIFPCPPLRLARLILTNPCWFPGGIPLGQLTHLRIMNSTTCRYSSLVALLRQCVLLQELVLADIPAMIEDNSHGERPVELPHLRLLTLGCKTLRWAGGYLLRAFVYPPTLILRLFGFEEAEFRGLAQSPASFTRALDTLVFQDASPDSGVVIQAASPDPSCGLLIHADSIRQPYTTFTVRLIRQLFFGLFGPVDPLGSIKQLTISSAGLHESVPFFPAMPSVVYLRLVDSAPLGLVWNNDQLLLTAFHACVVRFPNLVELEIWSPRGLIRELPCMPGHLKRYTFHHIGREKGESTLDSRESSLAKALAIYHEHGVEFVECDAKEEPDVDLPGIRPARGLSDW
ncbi:hypothetical protein C8Q70DRAFT_1054488 [Cubamyces menziesii]|nr:hypothetical protein C8Q70DRAFT_1054488 [Cubamyces menziesii]